MSFALATFNVKNLLDPRDEGERSLLPEKLDAIARTLRACDADVVGLEEIGPARLLREIVAKLSGCGYVEPLLGTADARGIRCALLSRVPIVQARVHTAEVLDFPVYWAGDPAPFGSRIPLRRGVVHARVEAPSLGEIDVLVVHFKSPLPLGLRDSSGAQMVAATPRAHAEGMLRSLVWRAAEALYTRGLVDQVLAGNPRARIAVVGDLNDVPGSPVVRALQGDVEGAGEGKLFDCATVVEPATRFSALHRGRPTQIDHVLATASLYERRIGARFLNADLRDHAVLDPRRGEPMTVDSDHAPLVVRFG
jgi:endonuclease/exonuclease/phosphatase family metal-dependent hydrolase